jgi:hypothetical protein
MTTETTLLEERLYDYFIQTGTLSLPGIGTFRLQRISPHTDPVTRKLLPPSFTVRYDRREDAPRREMFDYLARRNGGDDMKAVRSVNQLSYTLRTRLLQGESCGLPGIGTILPDNGTGFRFDPQPFQYNFNPDVSIRRVVREEESPPILVGEEWVSMSEQEERLHELEEKRQPRRIPLMVWLIVLLSLALLLLRGYMTGFSPFMSRYSPFTPAEPAPTHTVPNAP